MVKTAATADEKMCLRRECRNYRIPDVAASQYIRALCDTVQLGSSVEADPAYLVFEWMDHDLKAVTAPEFRGKAGLPRAVSRAVLEALSVLKRLGAVHTGRWLTLLCTSPMLT